jgi:lathosterol oxidase
MQRFYDAKAVLVPWAHSKYAVNLSLCVIEYAAVSTALCAARGRWPPRALLRKQVLVSLRAMPFYALLPTAIEQLALQGSTALHAGRVSILEALVFLGAAEALVYAVHRALHENRFLYTAVHRAHHEYKSAAELSPFASLAFHPLDGLAQAAPYALLAFALPLHVGAWEVLLFLTGVWSSTIHDDASWACTPWVLGAKHHTLHHTMFRCNYGQFFTVCDWLGGTLRALAD